MEKTKVLPTKERALKSYTFDVVLEPDKWPDESDSEAVWHVYVPALRSKGVASWGHTQQEALENIQDVLQMVLESMIEHGEAIPEEPTSEISVSSQPRVAVNL